MKNKPQKKKPPLPRLDVTFELEVSGDDTSKYIVRENLDSIDDAEMKLSCNDECIDPENPVYKEKDGKEEYFIHSDLGHKLTPESMDSFNEELSSLIEDIPLNHFKGAHFFCSKIIKMR